MNDINEANEKFSRICPSCGEIIYHKRLKDRNAADKNKKLCRKCCRILIKERDTPNKNFSRECPICSKLIFHTTLSGANRAIRNKNKCDSCRVSSLWENEDSPLRKEETRLKRNAGVSNARKDPESGYHSKEYLENKSKAHKALWDDPNSYFNSPEAALQRSENMRELWKDENYRNKRLSKETLENVTNKIQNWIKENYFEFISKLKLSWDNEDRRLKAKERFLSNLESEEFRNKLWGKNTSIRVSKLELKVKDQLEKLGYQHSEVHKKYINRYLPDFLNEDNKSIIEIYGDYWHCNPNNNQIYSDPNYYHTKLKMYSSDKWALDLLRTEVLISMGYNVKIIWETDIENSNYDMSKLL